MGGAAMKRLSRKGLFPLVLGLLLCWAGAAAGEGQEPEKVRLNADRVEFDEASGSASASGNVKLTHKDFRLFSPYLEYDTEGQKVRATADPGGEVTLLAGANAFRANGWITTWSLVREPFRGPAAKWTSCTCGERPSSLPRRSGPASKGGGRSGPPRGRRRTWPPVGPRYP